MLNFLVKQGLTMLGPPVASQTLIILVIRSQFLQKLNNYLAVAIFTMTFNMATFIS